MAVDLITLQARYAEADAALHDLRLGKGVVDVWRDGRRIRYTQTDVTTLNDYLTELSDKITTVLAGGDPTAPPRRGSMRAMFGGRR
jgi:hypothetical protein